MAHKGEDRAICLLMAFCQKASAPHQSRSSINAELRHGRGRFAFPCSDPSVACFKASRGCKWKFTVSCRHPEAGSFSAPVKVRRLWHTGERLGTRVCTVCKCTKKKKDSISEPHVGFQPCLILFAFKLSFMLFGASFENHTLSYKPPWCFLAVCLLGMPYLLRSPFSFFSCASKFVAAAW